MSSRPASRVDDPVDGGSAGARPRSATSRGCRRGPSRKASSTHGSGSSSAPRLQLCRPSRPASPTLRSRRTACASSPWQAAAGEDSRGRSRLGRRRVPRGDGACAAGARRRRASPSKAASTASTAEPSRSRCGRTPCCGRPPEPYGPSELDGAGDAETRLRPAGDRPYAAAEPDDAETVAGGGQVGQRVQARVRRVERVNGGDRSGRLLAADRDEPASERRDPGAAARSRDRRQRRPASAGERLEQCHVRVVAGGTSRRPRRRRLRAPSPRGAPAGSGRARCATAAFADRGRASGGRGLRRRGRRRRAAGRP